MEKHRLGVVLVHGIRSKPAMWDPLTELIAADPGLDFVQPLPFSYSTGLKRISPTRTFPSFDTAADSLKEYLDTEGEPFSRLMLVAHSQGGLIVQRYLTRMLTGGRGRELARIRRIVLLACPTSGSEIFLSLRRSVLGSRHPQERQLRPLDGTVNDTVRQVMSDVVHARAVTDRTCPIPFSVYAGESDNIVPAPSAQHAFPDARALPGDHSTIARPTSPEHRTYTTLRRLMISAGDSDPPEVPRAIPSFPVGDHVHEASALGVHPAIHSAVSTPGLEPLPRYLDRAHDLALRSLVREAAEGRNRFGVLVGGSSTGKTRACFEALSLLDPSWRVWHPPSAHELVEGLTAQHPLSRTVLWLNETQRYLTNADDDPAARALHALLNDAGRGPVLVLGTLWPEHLRDLTHHDNPAERLLEDRQIPIEDVGFRSVPAAMVEAATARDPRLAEAIAASPDEATQYLAGGRELLARYQGGPEIRALIDAAVDTARLGYSDDVTQPFLSAAAWALLPESYKRTRGSRWSETWLIQALADAGEPCRGVPGPLTTLVTGPEQRRADGDTYRLADYLRQQISRRHVLDCPPDTWWEAAVTHLPSPAGLQALAKAAKKRARYRLSADLARRALGADPCAPVHELLVSLHWRAGHLADAEAAANQALELGNTHPALLLAQRLNSAGKPREAAGWQRRAAESVDSADAWAALATTLLDLGDVEDAVRAGRRIGDWQLGNFAYALSSGGHSAEALLFARGLAAEGNCEVILAEAGRLAEQDRLQDAIDLLEGTERLGAPGAYEDLMFLYEEAGDSRRAEEAGCRAVSEHGYGKALRRLCAHREEAGDQVGAARALLALGSCPDQEEYLVSAAGGFWEAGDLESASSAADQAIACGRPDGWVLLALIARTAGDSEGQEHAIGRAVRSEDGETWQLLGAFYAEYEDDVRSAAAAYRRAAELGQHDAWKDLAKLWHDAGDPARRDQAVTDAVAGGHVKCLWGLPEYYDSTGDSAAARTQALLAAEQGDEGPGFYLAHRWYRQGRVDDALTLALAMLRYGQSQTIGALKRKLWEGGDAARLVDALEGQPAGDVGPAPRGDSYLLAAYAATGATEQFRHGAEAEEAPPVLLSAARMCEERGLRAEALTLYERARDLGSVQALLALARLHSRTATATALLHRAVDAGAEGAVGLLVTHYETIGDRGAAERLRCYGIEAGSPATPW
ncbi:hypothetical protein ABZ371_18705 [Streptomyces sp. NPDC005899]|uniref:hypothetical protein n=1 Tax=Streptomyces sp. NPDC005899 TaxID=3155716 RepID=UPI00340A7AA6